MKRSILDFLPNWRLTPFKNGHGAMIVLSGGHLWRRNSADNQIGTCMGRQQGPAPGMKQGRALSIERSPLLRIDPQH